MGSQSFDAMIQNYGFYRASTLINYLNTVSQVPDFNKILLIVLGNNVLERREVLFDERETYG